MKAVALCDHRYAKSASRVVGGDIVMCCPPPLSDDQLELVWNIADFIYIDLHGEPGFPQWLFADGRKVLRASQLNGLPGGKMVFATTCHMPGTMFVEALRRDYFVFGSGVNYGARERVTGAPLLALWMRRFLELDFAPETALKLAKVRLVFSLYRSGDRDALSFQIALPRRAGGYV